MKPVQMTLNAEVHGRPGPGADKLLIESLAPSEIELLDDGGRTIGTAVVKDGRIHATITNAQVVRDLRDKRPPISMGYRVVIENTPSVAGVSPGGCSASGSSGE